jgi:hypothetical protein
MFIPLLLEATKADSRLTTQRIPVAPPPQTKPASGGGREVILPMREVERHPRLALMSQQATIQQEIEPSRDVPNLGC